MKNDIHDLGLVLDSKVKLVVIESWDEMRVLETLTGLAVKRGLGLHTWSVTEGLQRLGFGGEPVGELDSREPEQALRLMVQHSRAEAGNLRYDLFLRDDGQAFDLFELYADQAAVDAMREEIAVRLDARGSTFWLTIDFTADPAWT